MQTLIGFRNVMAEELYKMADKEVESVLKKISSEGPSIELMSKAVTKMRKDAPGMAFEGKGAFKERMTAGKKIAGNMEGNAPMEHARTSDKLARATSTDKREGLKAYDMDAKAPVVPIEILDEQSLRFLVKHRKGVEATPEDTKETLVAKLKKTGVIDGKGKEVSPVLDSVGDNMDPRLRSKIDVNDSDLNLSDDERVGDGPDKDMAPFMAGILSNLVDAKHKFIVDAKALNMPLKAGISGNAHRFMNQAAQMGAPLPGARMAIYGHLVTIEAHSFHEVMSASLPHVPYEPGVYLPFKPMPDGTVKDLAKSVLEEGTTVEDLLGLNRKAAKK